MVIQKIRPYQLLLRFHVLVCTVLVKIMENILFDEDHGRDIISKKPPISSAQLKILKFSLDILLASNQPSIDVNRISNKKFITLAHKFS